MGLIISKFHFEVLIITLKSLVNSLHLIIEAAIIELLCNFK